MEGKKVLTDLAELKTEYVPSDSKWKPKPGDFVVVTAEGATQGKVGIVLDRYARRQGSVWIGVFLNSGHKRAVNHSPQNLAPLTEEAWATWKHVNVPMS